ncbi:uncharacterized protein BcabD6B2_45030 [Babesia caballi]|uniref:Uncharacterized protein n=1 Tax=Babesia caballi TaxID=5871 RepID=A0AAV4LY24_BABCB|nr:hypothetical protein, conserved [Babesia caballi]
MGKVSEGMDADRGAETNATPPNGDSDMSEDNEALTQQTVAESEVDDTMTQDDIPASQVQEENGEIQVGQYSKTRTAKDVLVAQLLCRWWYVLPDWPPANYNYHEQLEKRMLKCYPVKEFDDRENVDSDGYMKCYQLSAFPGVFRDFKGVAHDLRPLEGKPCYNNMVQKSEEELVTLVKAAIRKQIDILTNSSFDEADHIKALREPRKEREAGLVVENLHAGTTLRARNETLREQIVQQKAKRDEDWGSLECARHSQEEGLRVAQGAADGKLKVARKFADDTQEQALQLHELASQEGRKVESLAEELARREGNVAAVIRSVEAGLKRVADARDCYGQAMDELVQQLLSTVAEN